MSQVRTRFAPSPTGFLHIGGARTALFNWAFTRRHGGSFALRVEDTDRERSTAESEAAVLEGMEWLGLEWDEGPIRQSERAASHTAAVDRLLASGVAYRCTATPEEIATARDAARERGDKGFVFQSPHRDAELGPDCGPHAVRLRVPREGRLEWDDLVFGPSGQDAAEIGDGIIRRSDGTPTYHLAAVVDDLELGITHVIRGADHHSNTPFHIALYRALGAETPKFAHAPLLVAEGGRKLSKRRDPVSIQQFRAEGHLPEAMINWLARLGWSHGDDEIFSRDDLAELFDLESVGRAPVRADLDKLAWLGQHYLKDLPADDLWTRIAPHLALVAGGPVDRTPGLDGLLAALRERAHTLVEMAEMADFALREPEGYEEKAARKHLKPAAAPILEAVRDTLAARAEWSAAEIESALEEVREAQGGIGMGKIAQPVRVAVTGRSFSPGIGETLFAVGRERTLARLAAARQHAAAAGASTA